MTLLASESHFGDLQGWPGGLFDETVRETSSDSLSRNGPLHGRALDAVSLHRLNDILRPIGQNGVLPQFSDSSAESTASCP